MAIAGKVAITPKGEWNANTAYTKLDLVFYDNASYVAIQPSTGVEPTNTSYWMLVVQSAGGADLDGIISGDIQVGNAKTLDGHEAEDFLQKSGGTINGDVGLYKDSDALLYMMLKNALRQINIEVQKGGTVRLRDATNSKDIINSTVDGTNTFNGHSSEDLPLTGGMLQSTSREMLRLKNLSSADSACGIGFYNKDGTKLGEINVSIYGLNFIDSETGGGRILHTGNKPTGSYTGNGDATERIIATGGLGDALLVTGNGYSSIVVENGAFSLDSEATITGVTKGNTHFINGSYRIGTTSPRLNASGVTYTWRVL